MGLLDAIDDQHKAMTDALVAFDPTNKCLEEAKALADDDQKAILDETDVDGFGEQRQKLIYGDLLCRLQLEKSMELLEKNPKVLDGVDDPPLAIDELKVLAKDQQKFTKWRQEQTDPTFLYQVVQWAEKLVTKIYEHMKSCVLSAIQETQSLIQGGHAVDTTLEELKMVRQSLQGLIDNLLHTAQALKTELVSFKTQIAETTQHTGILDVKSRTQALFIRSKMTGLKTHFQSLQDAFLESMSKEVRKKQDEYDNIVKTHKKQMEAAKEAGGLLDTFKKGFEAAAALVMGGGSAVVGLAFVAVLIFAGVLTGGLAIALCVGGVVAGASGIAALSYLYACNASQHHEDFKNKLEEVTTQMMRLSNLMMTLVNALQLIQFSFSLIEKQIHHILGRLTEKLVEYPNTQVVGEWTDADWKDEKKLGALANNIVGDDKWGTEIEVILGIAGSPKVSLVELTNKVDQAIEDLGDFENRLKQASKEYLSP